MTLLKPEDLEELSGNGGEPFARCMRELVLAEVRHSIAPQKLDFDSRVAVPDGGVDLRISADYSGPDGFVPKGATLWSFKSGEDGTKPATLTRELTSPSHGKLRVQLSEGYGFVWCSPLAVGQLKRQEFESEARRLERDLGLPAGRIEFRWQDQIQAILERHLGIIAAFLPRAFALISGVFPLSAYLKGGPDHRHSWAELPDRADLKRQIQEHLKATEGPPLLHVAGLSGVGKSRLVLQACADDPELHGTLVIPTFDENAERFLRGLADRGVSAKLVFDEVRLERVDALQGHLDMVAPHVRAVSIGPAPRSTARQYRSGGIRVLKEPSNEAEVLQVVQTVAPTLDESVARSIAECSGHDLRLALLLTNASLQNTTWRAEPVRGMPEVWRRVVGQLPIPMDESVFAGAFDLLSISIDVGHAGRFAEELNHLAKLGAGDRARLLEAMEHAAESGLGVRTAHFFESGPRALATWAFHMRLWPRIRNRLDEVMGTVAPERLRRRFFERCQELSDTAREEVIDCVSATFLGTLGPPELATLGAAGTSREFQAWCELDPNRGLRWLSEAVNAASPSKLAALHGRPGSDGHWAGRRQIVWLCEHLACFSEHFWECEKILFRLAQVETEPSIGNNSTETWKGLFLPILSFTEVPFEDRWQLLIRRLRVADQDSLALVLGACIGAIGRPGARMMPPPVVGGRVVPDEWRPATQEALRALQRGAAIDLLAAASSLLPHLRAEADLKLAPLVYRFIQLEAIDSAQAHFADSPDPRVIRLLRRLLDERLERDEFVKGQEGLGTTELSPALRDRLVSWRAALEPQDPMERILDVTSRESWRYTQHLRGSDAELAQPFDECARLILQDPSVLAGLRDWFASSECKSGYGLGTRIGEIDEGRRFESRIVAMLRDAGWNAVVGGYLWGQVRRCGGIGDALRHALSLLANEDPARAIELAIRGDLPEAELQPLLGRLTALEDEQLRSLVGLGYGKAGRELSTAVKERVLRALHDRASHISVGLGIHLASAWRADVRSPEPAAGLVEACDRLLVKDIELDGAASAFDWWSLVRSAISTSPTVSARAVAEFIAVPHDRAYDRRNYAETLATEVAAAAPAAMMEAIGAKLLDPARAYLFEIHSLKGLFEAIGLEVARPWVESNGTRAAEAIARHLVSPILRDDGSDEVSPLADWLLTTHGTDSKVFRRFLVGRHSFEVRGPASDGAEKVRREMDHFSRHPAEWVRQWAKFELDELAADLRREEIWDDEDRRA
jgi:hypothetical protein